VLAMLPADELNDIRDNGPFPLEMRCHYCNTVYHFDKKEIQAIYSQR
jgi:molecular chaperone Hsp33